MEIFCTYSANDWRHMKVCSRLAPSIAQLSSAKDNLQGAVSLRTLDLLGGE